MPDASEIDTDVVWGQPPRRGESDVDWQDIADVLASRGGEWARVLLVATASRASGVVQAVRRGRLAAIDPDLYEATSRRLPDGRGGVWMRKVKSA